MAGEYVRRYGEVRRGVYVRRLRIWLAAVALAANTGVLHKLLLTCCIAVDSNRITLHPPKSRPQLRTEPSIDAEIMDCEERRIKSVREGV